MSENKLSSKKRQLKKQPSVREKAAKASQPKNRRRILHSGRTKIAKPFKSIAKTGRKEYYLPMPDHKVGRFLNKKRHFIPTFFTGAWAELKLVVWPKRKETIKLTFSVFMFAIFFMIIISAADSVLDKVFKQLILK